MAKICNTDMQLMIAQQWMPHSVSNQIDCKGWPDGLYIIELQSPEDIFRAKIIKIGYE